MSISNHNSKPHNSKPFPNEPDFIEPNAIAPDDLGDDTVPLEENTLDAVTALQGEYWHGQMKILIVDATQKYNDHLDPLLKLLDVVGYKYQLVSSSTEALLCIKQEIPDLILLEVLLPDQDGFSLCQMLRQDHNLQDTTIVFISEITDPESKFANSRMKCNGF